MERGAEGGRIITLRRGNLTSRNLLFCRGKKKKWKGEIGRESEKPGRAMLSEWEGERDSDL